MNVVLELTAMFIPHVQIHLVVSNVIAMKDIQEMDLIAKVFLILPNLTSLLYTLISFV